MPVQGDDVVRVICSMEVDGVEDMKNVFHVRHDGTVAIDDLVFMTGVAAHLDDAYDFIDSAMSDTVTFVDIAFENITRDINMGAVDWPTLIAGGDTAGERLPLQCAALVSFPTATTRFHGKKYMGGLVEGANSADGLLAATVQTNLVNFAAEVLSALTITGQTITFGNYNVTLGRWAAWVAATVDLIWSTQRRRKQGVGS